jgi:hypothetical protein
VEALKFGRRSELLEEARKRIHDTPDAYVHHIFTVNARQAAQTGSTSQARRLKILACPSLATRTIPSLPQGPWGPCRLCC